MAREISISFALNAALTGRFKGAFQTAAQSAKNVGAAIREMEKSPVGKIGAAMTAQREKIRGLAGSLKEARVTLAALQSQAQASGTSTKLLATQIRQAEERVNNLNGALSRQRSLLLNTAAQAATSGKSIRQLGQEYNSLTQNIERSKKIAEALGANRAQGDALRSQRADLNGRLAGAMASATTVAAPVALSIGFEDQMAKVGAVSRAGKDDLAALTEQARQLGRDTSYSASQAAEGMQYLAMAGFKTKQTMAAMPGMLDLAAASGTDLGATANIASNILSAFELKAEDMGHVGDVLVAAFTSSNTTLESLGDTMKYVGPVAKDAGASIEDAVAMAAMLGNVGIDGSQAGTTAKSIYARLAAPPTEAAKALNALNIQTKDARGNLRAVPDLLEEITLKTAGMGTADRTDVFSKVFGLEPMAGASALAKKAAETVDENGRQIVDSMGKPTTALLEFVDKLKHASDDKDGMGGMSRRVAAQMNATTGGAIRRMQSAWADAGISVGNLFLPAIRTAAGGLSLAANAISAFTERFPTLSRYVALAVGGFLAVTAGSVALGLVLNMVKTGLNGVRGGLLRMAAGQIAATATSAAFGAASTAAGAGARFFAGGLRSILMATGVGALLVGLGYGVSLLVDNWAAVSAAMSGAWSWVTTTWGQLGVFFSELGNNLAAIFPGIAQGISGAFTWARDGVVGVWSTVSEFFAGIWNGISSGASALWQGVTDLAAWAYDGVAAIWNGAVEFFGGIVNGISGVFSDLFAWLQEKFAWVFSAIDAVSSTIGSITGAVKGAWNKAFGGDEQSAAPAAQAAGEKSAAQSAAAEKPALPVKTGPKYAPVSARAFHAAREAGKSRTGGGGKSGSGSRAASAAKDAASSSPLTVVTLGGDNSKPVTTFIPAGQSAASATGSKGPLALPQAPGLIKSSTGGKSSGNSPSAFQIDLTQNFDLITQDAAAVRKVMESLKPDFEALVSHALEKLQSDRRRTAYAQ